MQYTSTSSKYREEKMLHAVSVRVVGMTMLPGVSHQAVTWHTEGVRVHASPSKIRDMTFNTASGLNPQNSEQGASVFSEHK